MEKKIQQYCSAVDKIKHDPACKQEVLNMAQQKNIHMTKRGGRIAGTAIAAALLAANVGGGYLLLHGRNQQTDFSAATSIASEIEDVSAAVDTEVLPCYVSRVQEYYAAKTGKPCDFEFTGWGRDFDDVSAEDENWRVELKAVTGCDWVLYYFYDVTPLKGQTTDEFQQTFPAITFRGSDQDGPVTSQFTYGFMPGQTPEPDNGVWHLCGIVYNTGGIPFSAEGTKLKYHFDRLEIEGAGQNADSDETLYELDYTPQSVPLYDRGSDLYFTYDVNRMCPDANYVNPPQFEKDLGEIPLRRTAISPFGMFCISNSFETGRTSGWEQTIYSLQQKGTQLGFDDTIVQVDENNTAVDQYCAGDDTYFGTYDVAGNAVAFIHILYDHPLDTAKGALQYPYQPTTEPPITDTTETETPTTDSEHDYNAEPRLAPEDVPCVVYSAKNYETGETIDTITDYYPDLTPAEQAVFEQVAAYSRYAKLLLNGRELKGIGEEIAPDENNLLNFTFEWTPDTNLKNQDISIEIRPAMASDEPITYGNSAGENIVMIEPYDFGSYMNPVTNQLEPSSIPDAAAAFTPDLTSENCVPLRYTLPIDISNVNLTDSPRSRQLSILIDYHAADNSGSKKKVIFRQEYMLTIKK